MKAVVAAFNQEKALVGAFSVITNLRMDPFESLVPHLRYGGAEARCEATVVTAYFEMASKHSHEQYLAWMANMLTYRDCMVVFTNQHLVE